MIIVLNQVINKKYIYRLNNLVTCTPKQSQNAMDVMTLTNFLWQHLKIGHPVVFEQLNAVNAVKAIIFDHVKGTVNS